jgi:predicted transcriptional regulator
MTDKVEQKMSRQEMLRLSGEVVSAYVGKNPLPSAQISEIIEMVFATFTGLLESGVDVKAEAQKPAVNPKRSIFPDHIVCLEDGKKLKMLKRHLRTTYGMNPDEYRAKWGLGADYPMVAPNYAAQRSDFAKKIGLGRKPGARKGRK